MKKYVFVIVAAVLVLCCNLVNAEPTVWYVHPDSNLNSIDAALDSCADNDIVLVGPGIYYENIYWPNTFGIHCISELGAEFTIVDGSNPSHPDSGSVFAFSSSQDSNTVLRGFTITNGTGTVDPWGRTGGGILCLNSSPLIVNNIITQNSAEYGAGMECVYNSAPFISNNIITDNIASYEGGGLDCAFSASPSIVQNTFNGNTALHGGGISIDSLSQAVLNSNTISQNIATVTGGGIGCYNHASPLITGDTIIGNICYDAGGGIYSDYCSLTVTDNYIYNNTATNEGGGIFIRYSTASITGNTIDENDAAYGGGISSVSYSTANIVNNAITNNTASADGGGLDCWMYFDGVIRHNIITGNTSALYGAGISCVHHASPTIDSCTISNNNGDGITCDNVSLPVINYNDIYNNSFCGIRNIDSTVIVDAEYNWWGDATGPCHPDSNPGGLGDTVSDYVDFIPWLTQPGIELQKFRQITPVNLHISPNPFCKSIIIKYTTTNSIECSELSIYDAAGRLIKEFNNLLNQTKNSIIWDATDNAGHQVPNGIYFLQFKADKYTETRKVLLIK